MIDLLTSWLSIANSRPRIEKGERERVHMRERKKRGREGRKKEKGRNEKGKRRKNRKLPCNLIFKTDFLAIS